jgi:hypothetical protein
MNPGTNPGPTVPPLPQPMSSWLELDTNALFARVAAGLF